MRRQAAQAAEGLSENDLLIVMNGCNELSLSALLSDVFMFTAESAERPEGGNYQLLHKLLDAKGESAEEKRKVVPRSQANHQHWYQ